MAIYSVGDTVYGSFGRYGDTDVRVGTVAKVTPTGQITVEFNGQSTPLRFKGCSEIGGDKWHGARLIDADTYARQSAEQRKQDARRAARNACSDTSRVNLDFHDDVLAAIEAARVAVQAYKDLCA
jgi:hypothetical protein